jgi:putative addiction module component
MDGSRDLPSVEQLAMGALALPASARAELAHRLLLSLDESHDDDAEAFALREALRRSDELDRGVVRPVPVAEAVERLRAGPPAGRT